MTYIGNLPFHANFIYEHVIWQKKQNRVITNLIVSLKQLKYDLIIRAHLIVDVNINNYQITPSLLLIAGIQKHAGTFGIVLKCVAEIYMLSQFLLRFLLQFR